MSDTPRTDHYRAEFKRAKESSGLINWILDEFGQLERELSQAIAERDKAVADIAQVKEQLAVMNRYLEQLTHPDAYRGERTGGVLKGCPRGPAPTPEQLAAKVKIALNHIRRMAQERRNRGT